MPLTPQQSAFLTLAKSYAPVAEAKGVPGSVMVAQAVVESAWGRSGLTRYGNAFFGVKARSSWRGKVYSGTTSEYEGGRYKRYYGTNKVYQSYSNAIQAGCDPVALFRAYDSPAENVNDYADFFQRNSRYHSALERYAQTKDPRSLIDDEQFARDIARAGYATGPQYAQTLISFINQYCRDLLVTPNEDTPPVLPVIRVSAKGTILSKESVVVAQDGRVFVHIRSFADALGLLTSWDATSRTVTVGE